MLLNYGILVYLYDILLYSYDMASHHELSCKVFALVVKYKLYIKESKYHVFLGSVEFLGYIIDKKGVHIKRERFILYLHGHEQQY